MALSRRTGQRFQASIWPGFVDAMTGLLLVLFFVLSIFMVVQFTLRETITGQESELDQLAGEVAALAQALGLEEQRGTQLQARVGELTATLGVAERRVIELTAERDRTAVALAQAETQITSFEATVAALINERDGARAQVQDLQGERAALLSEQEALNLALAQARTEVDAGAEAARLAAARREALEALITDLETRATQAEAALARTEDTLGAEEAARLVEAAAAEALRERLANADTELTAMTLSLEAQRREAEETLALLAAAQAAEANLDEKLMAALLQIEGLQVAQTDIAESARTAQAQVADLQARSSRLEVEVNDLTTQLTAARASIAQLKADRTTTQTTATAAQARNTELELEVARLKAAADEVTSDRAELRAQLARALAAKLAAEQQVSEKTSEADLRAALLATAQEALAEETEISTQAQRQTALLNQQVAALRMQLGQLQGLLDAARAADAAKDVQLQSLGSDLNTALARVAAEERQRRIAEGDARRELEEEVARRRALEEAERQRLEAEKLDLERYRSEFFGQLRDLLGTQEGVRIVGDRFVFSSEVLFAPGEANLSNAGQGEIAKIASILRTVAGDIPTGIDWVLQVDGHTDNVPLSGTGKFSDNWELSQARALSVVRYMVDFLGLPPDRLSANGFGQFQPLNRDDSPEARAQNRRIEIKFTEK